MARVLPTSCFTVVGLAVLTTCATRVAHVDPAPADNTRIDHALLSRPGQLQYQMEDLSLFVMPMELETPAPVFPAGIAAGDVARGLQP